MGDEHPVGPANILCEHELSIILDHSCINVQDLLNYRLVNKNWRDAATRVLLQRNKCYIAVELSDRCENSDKVQFCKYPYRNRNRRLSLTDLTHLMSTTEKFPTTAFHLHHEKHSYEKCMRDGKCLDYSAFPELERFFQLHGGQIKSVRLEGCVWKKNLVDLLLNYTPNLDCLDLQKAVLLPYPNMATYNKKKSDSQGCFKDIWVPPADISWPSEKNVTSLKLKTVFFGFQICKSQEHILKFVFSALSNVKCIENIDREALRLILREGKGHLIKSFTFSLGSYYHNENDVAQIRQFATLRPSLTKLELQICNTFLNQTEYQQLKTSLNLLFESSAKTIQCLKVCVDRFDIQTQLSISPMPSLKCLILIENPGRSFSNSAEDTDRNDFPLYFDQERDNHLLVFNENMSMKEYFPALRTLDVHGDIENMLRHFFSFKLSGPDLNSSLLDSDMFNQYCANIWDMSPSVGEALDPIREEDNIPSIEIFEIRDISRLLHSSETCLRKFPNIRVLKVGCFEATDLDSSLWLLFPLAESIEIEGIATNSASDEIEKVDQFFTGYSLATFRKLRSILSETEDRVCSNSHFMFTEERQSSLYDLPRLTNLKLCFGRLKSQFASEVTGIYAFQKMAQTKITICFDPKVWTTSGHTLEATHRYLAPIAPYVQIVHEEIHSR